MMIPLERVQDRILLIRGNRVIIDRDLAELYGVETKRLNEQVKRNISRFPEDFVFQLSQEEKDEVVANCDHLSRLKFSKVLPNAFTEHGAIMAANVLNSEHAIRASVFIVRAFVKLRELAFKTRILQEKLDELERRIGQHDDQLQLILAAIRQMFTPPKSQPISPKRKIGFEASEND